LGDTLPTITPHSSSAQPKYLKSWRFLANPLRCTAGGRPFINIEGVVYLYLPRPVYASASGSLTARSTRDSLNPTLSTRPTLTVAGTGRGRAAVLVGSKKLSRWVLTHTDRPVKSPIFHVARPGGGVK
jgi:hypothetical protein